MTVYARWAAAAGLALGLGALALVGPGRAADDKDKKVPPEVIEGVDKIAAALGKDKMANVGKDLDALKKHDLKLAMKLFKKRDAGGYGVGKPSTFDPDGIERQLEKLADGAGPALGKDADAVKELGLRTAAIAAVAEARAPAKDDGKKKVKDWKQWSADMKAGGLDLAAAAQKKDAAAVQKAADKINKSCAACHDKFRDDE